MAQASFSFSGVSASNHVQTLVNVLSNRMDLNVRCQVNKFGLFRYELTVFGNDYDIKVVRKFMEIHRRNIDDSRVYSRQYLFDRGEDINFIKRYAALYFGEDQLRNVRKPWFGGDIRFNASGTRSEHSAFMKHWSIS